MDKLSEMSVIVELLQYEESVPDDKAAVHYFTDLSVCNEVFSYVYLCCFIYRRRIQQ